MRKLIGVCLFLLSTGICINEYKDAHAASGINNGMSGVFSIGLASSPTPAPTASPAPTATPQPTTAPQATFPSTGNFGAVSPYFTETDDGNSSTADTINFNTGGAYHKSTITGNCTYTFTAPNGPGRVQIRLVHEASATAYTLTWPATVKWPGGVAGANTNSTGAVDILTCYYDGTNYNCTLTVNFS